MGNLNVFRELEFMNKRWTLSKVNQGQCIECLGVCGDIRLWISHVLGVITLSMEDFNFQMNKEGKSNDKIDSKGPRKMALKKGKKEKRRKE